MSYAPTMNPAMESMSLQTIVDTALEHCLAFIKLLQEENEALSAKKMSNIDELTKQKRHLAAKLEVSMKNVQAHKAQLMQTGSVSLKMEQLTVYLDMYKQHARKNLVLLKASHEATTQFIDMVRKAVSMHKPQAKTYGNTGAMQENANTTNLVIKSV